MPVEAAWTDYYRDEMDAAWLYRALAAVERNGQRRAIFENLAHVEDTRFTEEADGRCGPSGD